MTYADQIAILNKSTSWEDFRFKSQYQTGREAAIEDIAEGKQDLTSYYPHAEHLFGKAWVKGYTDYFHAWQILNGTN